LSILRNVRKKKIAPSLVPALLAWFGENARDLPWRRTRDPYGIWVSEIMLQQTQVKTVIPYWNRWMRQLPGVASLAKAAPERVLKLWEGLGYYTRARNLQKAAQIVSDQYGGKFPEHFEDVLALPGVGRYTAGAICSIAFNQPTPILDGNVVRVLTRLFGIEGNPREKLTNTQLWALAGDLVSCAASTSGDWKCSHLNQALMELGALVCTPSQPKCDLCPIVAQCAARRTGRVEAIPNLGRSVPATARRFAAFIAENRGCFLVRQRPADVINAHLWEFPNAELTANSVPLNRVAELVLQTLPASLQPVCVIKHTITRYRMTLEAYRVTLNRRLPKNEPGRWVAWEQLKELPFTSANRKLLGFCRPRPNGRRGPDK